MNILLVMPKVDIGYQDWPVPPVGIAYVSAALKEKGWPVWCVNMNLETNSLECALREAIGNNSIDVVATGGLIVNYHTIKEIIDTAKRIKPEVITYIGGSLVTFSPEAVMSGIKSADIGMIGEGEITVCELIEALEENNGIDFSALRNINGLIIRGGDGELFITPKREEIMDIDSLPFPDYDGFRYFEMVEKFWNTTETGIISAPLTTSRSCPFRCTFCSKSGGEKYRQRTLDNIFDELDMLVHKYHVNRILLNDELFANDSERIKEFCRRIKAYGVLWFVSLRVSKHITKELLEMMKDSGCIQILYGLESGDNNILKSMRKGITTDEIKRVVHLTADAGFQVRGNFIFGDPMETLETVHNTISFIERNLDVFTSVALSPIILFPGSVLYKQALADGTITNELEFIERECPIKNVSKMSDEEYFEMVNSILPKAKIKLNADKYQSRIHKFDIDKSAKEYVFEYQCPHCNFENKFYMSNTEVIMRTDQYICADCKETLNINVAAHFAKMLFQYLQKICKKYRVALWGCGQNMAIIDEYADGFSNLEYILLDTDSMKIGKTGIGGKMIYAPKAIDDFTIDFVMEMTSVRRLEIKNRVNREFPKVKYVYSMFDIPLCSDEYM